MQRAKTEAYGHCALYIYLLHQLTIYYNINLLFINIIQTLLFALLLNCNQLNDNCFFLSQNCFLKKIKKMLTQAELKGKLCEHYHLSYFQSASSLVISFVVCVLYLILCILYANQTIFQHVNREIRRLGLVTQTFLFLAMINFFKLLVGC